MKKLTVREILTLAALCLIVGFDRFYWILAAWLALRVTFDLWRWWTRSAPSAKWRNPQWGSEEFAVNYQWQEPASVKFPHPVASGASYEPQPPPTGGTDPQANLRTAIARLIQLIEAGDCSTAVQEFSDPHSGENLRWDARMRNGQNMTDLPPWARVLHKTHINHASLLVALHSVERVCPAFDPTGNSAKDAVNVGYAGLFQQLMLPPDKSDALHALLARRMTVANDIFLNGVNQGGDIQQLRALVQKNEDQVDQDIHSLLGDAGFKQFEDYETNLRQSFLRGGR